MAWECMEGVVCGKCGEKGHLQRNCKQISCHKCGRKGHIARFCNDPFVKAAEVERHERLQALASSRAPAFARLPGVGVFEMREVETTCMQHKDARGPWDGLGSNRLDMISGDREQEDRPSPTSSEAAISHAERKRRLPSSSSVQGMVSQRLKIVSVKCDSESRTPPPLTEPLKAGQSSILPWEGLVDYGTEDSDDDQSGDPPG
ncbi:hypothetical protein KP509_26G008800 [Ceratopteris richardii]|nr:hypothetical protein KP509_26G008800 [Ceratopteris richardii]